MFLLDEIVVENRSRRRWMANRQKEESPLAEPRFLPKLRVVMIKSGRQPSSQTRSHWKNRYGLKSQT